MFYEKKWKQIIACIQKRIFYDWLFANQYGHSISSGLILEKSPTSPSPILMKLGVLKLTFTKLSSVKF